MENQDGERIERREMDERKEKENKKGREKTYSAKEKGEKEGMKNGWGKKM